MAKIVGFDKVIANLNREIKLVKGRTMKGLIEGAIIIRRDMDKTAPLIPIDTGNLRASWFMVTAKGDETPAEFNSGQFKQKNVDQMTADHTEVKSEAQGLAGAAMGQPVIIMGFSANYATFVHENVGANFAGDAEKAKRGGKYLKYSRREGAGAKFFEESINRNKDKVLVTIQENARIR